MGHMGCSETSIINYQSTLRNIPEERTCCFVYVTSNCDLRVGEYADTDFCIREVSFKGHPICLFFLCFYVKYMKSKNGWGDWGKLG
jgi:hypothetical protein